MALCIGGLAPLLHGGSQLSGLLLAVQEHAGNVRGISWEMMENGGPPWTPRDNQQDGGEDILQNGWKPEGMDTLFKFEISMEWGYELASLLSCKNVFRLCVCDNGG